MQKIIGLLFLLSSYGFGAIGSLTIPHDIDSAAIPKVIYIDQNNDSIVNKVNEIKDTVNAYLPGGGVYTGTALTSTGNLRLTVDSDNNGTGNCLAITHNGASDTIAKFCDDLASRAFGALTISGRATLTDSLIGVSQRLSGNLAADNGAFSGTVAVTGLQSNAEALAFTGNGTITAGRIGRTAAGGLVLWGIAGSSYDLSIRNAAGDNLIQNPTGGSVTEFPRAGGVSITGPVTHSYTLTQTGLQSNSEAIAFTANGTSGSGRIWKSASHGLQMRAVTGSSNDINIESAAAVPLILNPTGTANLTVGNASGSVTNPGTLTQTGAATFTAAPVFSSVTASQFLLVDGSKALTSVAGTGSGSVVRATSPTLVTPALGAATATSIVASGNVTADSLISSKFYEEGTFTATLRGCLSDPTGTAYYTRVGKQVTLAIPYLSCTSDSAGAAITGLPASIHSARRQGFPVNWIENSTNTQNTSAGLQVDGAAVRFILLGPLTASGTRTLYGNHGSGGFTTITYTLQ